MSTYQAFIGDRVHALRLGRNEIVALEDKLGGIGSIWRRLLNGDFAHADLTETIRNGLIGGGATPQAAATLVERHVASRPLAETLPIAIGVLEILFVGPQPASSVDIGSQQ